jgi:diguanylate cyclase
MLARAARTATRVQVAFVDLDGFKTINDEHGHDIGDRFLLHIAHRLRAGVRIGDYAGRFGGDEFVVIAPGDEADRLGERVARSTATTFRHGAVDIDYPGASVGVVVSGPGEADAEALLARADAAMYAVKKARRAAR